MFYIITSFIYTLGFGILIIQGENLRVLLANITFAVVVISLMLVGSSLEWFICCQSISILLILFFGVKKKFRRG